MFALDAAGHSERLLAGEFDGGERERDGTW
jgi:hypothetical protein